MLSLETVSQISLTILSLAGVVASVSHNFKLRRWSPVLGVVAQPFWLYSTWHAGMWGIFAVSFVYLAIYSFGVWNLWSGPKRYPALKVLRPDIKPGGLHVKVD